MKITYLTLSTLYRVSIGLYRVNGFLKNIKKQDSTNSLKNNKMYLLKSLNRYTFSLVELILSKLETIKDGGEKNIRTKVVPTWLET